MKHVLLFAELFLTGCLACSQPAHQQVRDADGIKISSMSREGLDSSVIMALEREIQKGIYPNIHSLLIARHNQLLYEKYWPGRDEKWGDSLGIIGHGREDLHDMRSISKSFVSACIGIAIAQGRIKSVDQKVFDFFPEYARLDTGWKAKLTIQNLLTMSSGLHWNEEVPYTDPQNSEIRMIRSANPVEYVLSQPMDFPPGKVWKYNGGNTQLLAAILEKTTGKKLDQFAREFLFQPLAISTFDWIKFKGTDLPAAASGLRLRSRDLLKFGLLVNERGVWNNQRIIPAEWIEQSLQFQIARLNGGKNGYGYQFWIFSDSVGGKWVRLAACVGNGDQHVFFDRDDDMVIVITAGNYNNWTIRKDSHAILKDYIYPALRN